MPESDLSAVVPPGALWVKIHYEMSPKKPGADLIARLWSDVAMKDPVVVRGATGDVFVKLNVPQKLFYQNPVTVQLKLKVTAYKDSDSPQ